MNPVVISWNELNAKSLPLLKRALYYGDGFFETMRWHHGRPFFWEHHKKRIEKTAYILSLPIPYPADILLPELQKHLLPDIANQRLRLSFVRTGEGFYTPKQNGLIILVEFTPLPETSYTWQDNPFVIGISSIKKLRHPFSTLKLLSAENYVVAGLEARQNNWDEAILLNDAGNVCEAISHNIFIIKQDALITPSLDEGCLQGIMRSVVIQLCKDYKILITERSISLNEWNDADEIFLTNVISGIRSVSTINQKTLKNNLTKIIFQKLLQTIR